VSKTKAPHVVAGGKIGEIGHCTHCGRGLSLGGGPQPLPIVTAAMNAFVKMHLGCKSGQFQEPEAHGPEEWLRGRDTGTSSLTIYAAMMNAPSPHDRYDVPHDPDDFGRCYRLLNLFPDWKMRLGEVGTRFLIWRPFVREWNKLTEMYETALASKTNRAPEMYKFMQELEYEGGSRKRP
jgi:hypothetical protein